MQTNSLVHYSISYTVGSTDTKSGSPVFSLPVTALSPVVANWPRGNARLFDTSAAAYRHRTARHTSVTTVGLTDEDGTLVSATVPWTWATGDNIGIQGTYEAA